MILVNELIKMKKITEVTGFELIDSKNKKRLLFNSLFCLN